MNTSTSVKHAAVSKKLKKGILSQQNNNYFVHLKFARVHSFYTAFILFQLSTHEPVHNV